MANRITFYLILFSFLFYKEAFASEGGMPQLNTEFWISQIFWLTLVFGTLYLMLANFILPKISNNLETRKSQIVENIGAAEKQREESDQKIKDYENIINEAKIESKDIFNQARKKILKDINAKKESLKKEIDEEVKKAETEILDLKNKSPEKINKIAIETSADLIKQIIGVEVNNSNISAIVEDISKKMKRDIMIIDATFWVGISFVLFFAGLIYLKVPQKVNEILNNLISNIKNEIDESEKLSTEAKILWDKSQIKLESAQNESKKIIDEAKKESENLIIEMNDKFHKSSEIKKNLAKNKISQMKETALKEIKNNSIRLAVASVKKLISNSIDKSKLDNLFEKKLEESKLALKKINF